MSNAKSYTQYSMYKQCPRKYKLRYIDKVPDTRPKNQAASRGTMMHDSVEQFFLRKTEYLAPEVAKYKQRFFLLRENYDCVPEEKFCFTAEWEPTDWDSEDGYLRGVIDLKYVDNNAVNMLEWKSGKVWDDHIEQRNLYGMAALLLHPEADKAKVTNFYFDKDKEIEQLYSKAALVMYKDVWSKRIDHMDAKQPYTPFPGFWCRWCPYSKKAGGPCEFS
jgi:hypothetical protein